MKSTTPDRIKDQAARAEAWKRYAFRQIDRAEEAHARWQDAEMYAIREDTRARNEELFEMQREAQQEAREAYSEGYWKGREDGDGGGW